MICFGFVLWFGLVQLVFISLIWFDLVWFGLVWFVVGLDKFDWFGFGLSFGLGWGLWFGLGFGLVMVWFGIVLS